MFGKCCQTLFESKIYAKDYVVKYKMREKEVKKRALRKDMKQKSDGK
jgi:hypothetical protein